MHTSSIITLQIHDNIMNCTLYKVFVCFMTISYLAYSSTLKMELVTPKSQLTTTGPYGVKKQKRKCFHIYKI
jgi:hypothetical protein